MAGRIILEISGDIGELSPNRRLHWSQRAALVKEWRTKARLLYLSYRHPAFVGRVRVSFVVRRGRRLDGDNARGSLATKAVVDGLVDAGMTWDDSEKYLILGEVTQEISPTYRDHPELVVVIEDLEETDAK